MLRVQNFPETGKLEKQINILHQSSKKKKLYGQIANKLILAKSTFRSPTPTFISVVFNLVAIIHISKI